MASRNRDTGHEGHTHGVLSITETLDDGGHLHQSWAACGCMLAELRAILGRPVHELIASAEQAAQVGRAVDDVSGITHIDL